MPGPGSRQSDSSAVRDEAMTEREALSEQVRHGPAPLEHHGIGDGTSAPGLEEEPEGDSMTEILRNLIRSEGRGRRQISEQLRVRVEVFQPPPTWRWTQKWSASVCSASMAERRCSVPRVRALRPAPGRPSLAILDFRPECLLFADDAADCRVERAAGRGTPAKVRTARRDRWRRKLGRAFLAARPTRSALAFSGGSVVRASRTTCPLRFRRSAAKRARSRLFPPGP